MLNGGKMRLLGTVTIFATLTSGMALAQYQVPQDFSPVNPEGVSSYCYYAGTLYSVGARLCVPGTANSYVLVCVSKDEDSDKAKTGRAVWRVDGPPAPFCK
jgi:hypothetical protein